MKVSKAQLVSVLEDLLQSVKADDSFEGSLNYSCMEEGLEPGEFELKTTYRTGNSQGQGGCLVIE